jgi:glycosyltransferase involved in cell wall biosynthesis
MREDIKISVVIPVYGVEKYIRQCLESIINQTYKNLEIIVVNDGTKDNSMKIVEEYLSDERIKIINQENSGVSTARNKGIEEARGEYIAIIDSDDWIELNTFKDLMEMIEDKEDIIVFDFYKFDEVTQKIKKKTTTIEEFKNNIPEDKEYLISMYGSESCNKLYRREFLKKFNIKYEKMLYEDVFWKIETFLQAEKIKITGKRYYYYRNGRTNSIMWKTAQKDNDNEFIKKQKEAYEKMIELLDNFLEKNNKKFDIGKKILIEIEKKVWEEKYYHQIEVGKLLQKIKKYFFNKNVSEGEKKIISRALRNVLVEKKLEKIDGLNIFDIFLWKNGIIDFKFLKRRILKKS